MENFLDDILLNKFVTFLRIIVIIINNKYNNVIVFKYNILFLILFFVPSILKKLRITKFF